jgi:cytochrome c peroxidase
VSSTESFSMRLAIAVLLGVTCSFGAQSIGPSSSQAYEWVLPKGFPKPHVPANNPMTAAKVELGHHLFYDRRMSVNGKASCSTCHKQELAFTDGRAVAIGATGESHSRSSMSLVNVAYGVVLTWSNPRIQELEDQALVPMFGERPIELGLHPSGGFWSILRSDLRYQTLFARAFPAESEPFTIENVAKALACFERSIISASSPYDRYHYGGDDSAVSDSAKRGETLFFSRPLSCFRCHGGFNFSDTTSFEGHERQEVEFHNTGLYNLAGRLSYPPPNFGIYEYTRSPGDVGKFKTPTLRNIGLTAPYMHDGSIPTLEGVLEHYAAGGRTIAAGANAGVGHNNPNKDPLIGGFKLSPQDREDLVAFLVSLGDTAVTHDLRFANPW